MYDSILESRLETTSSSSSDSSEVEPMSHFFLSEMIVAVAVVILSVFFSLYIYYSRKTATSYFVFINDLHIDNLYSSNSSPTSGFCRTALQSPNTSYKYGQYGCDSPSETLKSLAEFLPTVAPSPAFILLCGDVIAHGLGTSREEIRSLINSSIRTIASHYSGVPILLAMGNNEYFPNYGSFDNDSDDFLSLSSILKGSLSDSEIYNFTKGGYYFRDIPSSKLRILILNSVIYSIVRDANSLDDPHDQFAFIGNASADAHEKGYEVGIAMHIPPGIYSPSMLDAWHSKYLTSFLKLYQKYDIKFILSAHSHVDNMLPLFDIDGTPDGHALSSPSISPAHGNNPSFRVYEVSDQKISDYVQYYADLILNPQDDLDWKIEYRFTQAYQQTDVSKDSVKRAANWVKTTNEGFWRYHERIFAGAIVHSAYYYCVLSCMTSEQIKNCTSKLQADYSSPYSSRKLFFD